MRVLVLTLMIIFMSDRVFGNQDMIDDCTLSPFLSAVAEGNISLVDSFLQSGEDINQRDTDGATPLIIAAVAEQYEMCLYLLSRGASITIHTHDGWNLGHILYSLSPNYQS